MRFLDFSTWTGVVQTLLGVALITLIGVGIRIATMLTIQQRQQRMNRQINERLKTLIAAYKTLGGSVTGELSVSPVHLRDRRAADPDEGPQDWGEGGSERSRRIRDAVEAALTDILLLGTEDQVRLAAQAAQDMVEGRPIRTEALVASLRDYVRRALDLEAIPAGVRLPSQGPARPSPGPSRGGGRGEPREGGGREGGGGMGGPGTGGGGMGGFGLGAGQRSDDP